MAAEDKRRPFVDFPLGDVNLWQSRSVLLQRLWIDATSFSAHERFSRGAPVSAAGGVYTGPDQYYAVNCTDESDPRKTYQDAIAMTRDLAKARLLTIAGWGHTELANPSACAVSYEVRYLTTGALPPAGTVCAQNGSPFPVPSP